MFKKVLILSALTMLVTKTGYCQSQLNDLLETVIGKSENETVRFLEALAGGKKPAVVFDGKYRSYSLEGPSFHMEYKVIRDTCVMVGIRFVQNAGQYNQFVQKLITATKPFGQNRVKELGSGKLIYVLNYDESSAAAISYTFALQSLQNSKQPF